MKSSSSEFAGPFRELCGGRGGGSEKYPLHGEACHRDMKSICQQMVLFIYALLPSFKCLVDAPEKEP